MLYNRMEMGCLNDQIRTKKWNGKPVQGENEVIWKV